MISAYVCFGSLYLLVAESEELKSLLMRVKEKSEKTDLKLNIQKTKIMASHPITSWQIEGEKLEAVKDFLFLGPRITVDGDCSHEIKSCLLKESYDKPRQYIKIRYSTLWTKVHIVKAMIFPVRMWELDHKKGWALKKWCFPFVVLEKTPEVPLNFKEIKPVSPQGNQSWIIIGTTVAEPEASVLWPLDAKSQFTGKEPDTGKGWRQKEKGAAEKWWLDSITNTLDMNLSKLWEVGEDRGAWHAIICGVTMSQSWLVTEQQQIF